MSLSLFSCSYLLSSHFKLLSHFFLVFSFTFFVIKARPEVDRAAEKKWQGEKKDEWDWWAGDAVEQNRMGR